MMFLVFLNLCELTSTQDFRGSLAVGRALCERFLPVKYCHRTYCCHQAVLLRYEFEKYPVIGFHKKTFTFTTFK